MDANAIKAQFPGYAGWNDPAAIEADFKATGGSGKGPPSGGGGGVSIPDPIEQAKKLKEFNIQSNQPYIQSLQNQIPTIQQKFATEKQSLQAEKVPLEQKYQTLLNDLKNKETQQVSTAQTSAAREFGRRGIPLSSTAYDQYLGGQVNPIQQNFATLQTQTVQDQEESVRKLQNLISSLTGQEMESVSGIQNLIGQLQSGDPASAIQGALSYNQQLQQAQQFNQELALKQLQQSLAEKEFEFSKQSQPASLKDQYMALGEGSTLYNLLTGQNFTAPKSYKPSDSFGDWG